MFIVDMTFLCLTVAAIAIAGYFVLAFTFISYTVLYVADLIFYPKETP